MSSLKSFYSTLYKRQREKSEAECLDFLGNLNIPKLSNDDRTSCEGKLTLHECWEALKSISSSKSPGNDDLTIEFYVCFFKDVGQHLIDALNLSFDYGILSTSQRQVVITLVEKKGKDKRYFKNWRPISLINVDTKILSKSLALRITKILSCLIHSDQTAYVKDRYIGESVRLINDVLEFTDHEKIEAILFLADFEKAFDSIDHSFLFSALECFGFGDAFIQWVRTVANNAESRVINNGHSTRYFLSERGTRQGDPLSAYLFILALEILFIQIRNNR